MLDRFPTAAAFVVTDISRDGALVGPDVEGLARAGCGHGATGHRLGRRGRAGRPAGLVRDRRLAGVIVGKAIYEGRFGVAAGVAALAAPGGAGADP